MSSVNQYIYKKRESFSNYSVVRSSDEQARIAALSLAQQTGSLALAPEPLDGSGKNIPQVYIVTKDIILDSYVPQGAKMAKISRSFKKGERLIGVSQCLPTDGGHIEVSGGQVDGLTYHFSCGKNSALRSWAEKLGEDLSGNGIVPPDYDQDGDKTQVEEEKSFIQKNKKLLIGVAIVVAIGIGYNFMNKSKG